MRQPAQPLGREAESQVLDEVVDQITERLQAGEPFDLDEYIRRYPELEDQLRKLVPGIQMLADLGHAPADTASSEGHPTSASPKPAQGVLGDYRILREVGRGGMGVVYEAEQVSLGRKVALKVLPFAAMMDKRQLQRFQNEARAAASLRHPNIVQVHFVGCERAVHFYAMDFIEGQTLAEVIRNLRGLEGMEGEAPPDPAKAGPDLADSLASGRFAPPKASSDPDAPTAAYAQDQTPEDQAPVRSDRIHAADHPVRSNRIHAVEPSDDGIDASKDPMNRVTTNRPPQAAISTERSTKSPAYFRSIAEIGVQVARALDHAHENGVVHRDVKPSNVILDNSGKPWVTDFGLARIETDATLTVSGDLLGTVRYMSPEQALAKRIVVDHRTDVYSLGVTLYELLTLRPVFSGQDRQELLRQIAFEEPKAPRRVNKAVPEELEIIVLKAMAKNPAERYDTAQELADDLKRFLEDRPIRARRPTLVQRAAKWSRRHKPIVWSAAASLLVVVTVLLASAVLLFTAYEREKRERAAAVANAAEAKENAARAAENAAKAQKNYERARDAVKQMLTRVADEQVGAIPEMKEIRRQLLEDAAAFYTELLKLSPRDPFAYFERGEVYFMLAKYRTARHDFEKAIELDSENAGFHARLASFLTYCPDVAHRDLNRGLVHARRAVELDPRNPDYQFELAWAHIDLRAHEEAKKELEKLADLDPRSAANFGRLARAYSRMGDAKNALSYIQKKIALDPANAGSQRTLAEVFLLLGKDEKALDAMDQAIELNPKPNETTTFYMYDVRGNIRQRLGMHESAVADFTRSIEAAPFRSFSHKWRARSHFELKNYPEALADIAEALELHPEDTSALWWIAPGKVAQCPDESFRERLLEVAAKAVDKSPDPAGALGNRAALYLGLGEWRKGQADLEKAVKSETANHYAHYQQALLWLILNEAPKYRDACAGMVRKFGETRDPMAANFVAWTCALAPDAVDDYTPVLACAAKAVEAQPESDQFLNTLGAILYRAGRHDEAIERLTELDRRRETADATVQSSPAYTWYFLAMAHRKAGNAKQAREYLNKANQWTDEALADKENPPRWSHRATVERLRKEAEMLVKAGAPESAEGDPKAQEEE